MNKLIGDITRPQFQSAPRLVETLKAHARNGQPTEFVCLESQVPLLNSAALKLESVPSGTHFSDIANLIWSKFIDPFVSTGKITDDRLEIVTNHKAVFELAQRIPSPFKGKVTFSAWSRIYQGLSEAAKAELRNAISMRPAITSFLPTEEILAVLRDALTTANATEPGKAIRCTSLRPFLAARDSRFSKDNPQTNMPGFITQLVRLAADSGVIKVDQGKDRANPSIWLAAPASPAVQKSVKSENARTSTSRSQGFIDRLGAKGLGPFSKVRPRLFAALQDLVTESSRKHRALPLSQLITETITRTKAEMTRERSVPEIYPWRHIRTFLIELLSRRSVLLDEKQQPISVGFQKLSAKVSALVPDWELELEGELILALVESSAELKLHDLNQLAGALYLDRSDKFENKVAEVIAFLLGKKRLVESEDHSLHVSTTGIIQLPRDATA
jgi:hypothetical protein